MNNRRSMRFLTLKHRPQKEPRLLCGLMLFARPLQWSRPADLKRSWRTDRGSAQTGMYPFALYCGAGLPAGFLCQVFASGHEKRERERVFPISDRLVIDDNLCRSSVHPNMGLQDRKASGACTLIIPMHSLFTAASITEEEEALGLHPSHSPFGMSAANPQPGQ